MFVADIDGRSPLAQVIAWAENCKEHGAPVFSILQQMYRVRDLGPNGKMTIYVTSSAETEQAFKNFPCTSEGVDRFLMAQHRAVLSYMPVALVEASRSQRVSSASSGARAPASTTQATLHDVWTQRTAAPTGPRFSLEFDRTSPSYHLLRAAIVMRHKSALRWSSILKETLTSEYGLDVKLSQFSAEYVANAAVQSHSNARKAAKLKFPFEKELLLSPAAADDLRQRQRSGQSLPAREAHQLYATHVFRSRFQILDDERFDESFYDTYIGDTASTKKTMWRKFLGLLR